MVEVARPPAYARFGGSHYIRNRRKKQQDIKAFDPLFLAPVDLGVVVIGGESDAFTLPSNGQLAIRAVTALSAKSLVVRKNSVDAFSHPSLEAGEVFKGAFGYVNEGITVTALAEASEGEFEICVVDVMGKVSPIAHGEVLSTLD